MTQRGLASAGVGSWGDKCGSCIPAPQLWGCQCQCSETCRDCCVPGTSCCLSAHPSTVTQTGQRGRTLQAVHVQPPLVHWSLQAQLWEENQKLLGLTEKARGLGLLAWKPLQTCPHHVKGAMGRLL